MIRFGVHCSLRSGLSGALTEAKAIGCESIQIFTRSPRMWKMAPPPQDAVDAFRALRTELEIWPLVVHTPYLPNLATSRQQLYDLSVDSMKKDLEVAENLGADYFVIHPGSYSEGSTSDYGIQAICDAINIVTGEVPGKTMLLLENVAGGGRRLGASFEELARMIDGINDKTRMGICFDTAHALGAGFDVASKNGVEQTLKDFDTIIGLDRLKVIHMNDSMVERGSRKDRHQHLGQGFVGSTGFRALISAAAGIADAGILETPKDAPDADIRNLKKLYAWRSGKNG